LQLTKSLDETRQVDRETLPVVNLFDLIESHHPFIRDEAVMKGPCVHWSDRLACGCMMEQTRRQNRQPWDDRGKRTIYNHTERHIEIVDGCLEPKKTCAEGLFARLKHDRAWTFITEGQCALPIELIGRLLRWILVCFLCQRAQSLRNWAARGKADGIARWSCMTYSAPCRRVPEARGIFKVRGKVRRSCSKSEPESVAFAHFCRQKSHSRVIAVP
jgi:hypothetical protein